MGGWSSSATSATTNEYSAQVTGGSGSNSPTVESGGGNVTITDEGATNTALAGMSQVALAAMSDTSGTTGQALDLLSNFNANEAAAQVQESQNNNALLASVLANNQTLAQNVQSGGATVGMDMTTKVVIGAMCLMGLLVAMLLFRK